LHPMYKIERYDHATEYSNYRAHKHKVTAARGTTISSLPS